MSKVLVIGALGQVGSELVSALCKSRGEENVIVSDVRKGEDSNRHFEQLDILDKDQLLTIVKKHEVKEIYLLAALLSATAEKQVDFAWKLNMEGLFNVLNMAREGIINKVFWPSSIAVFGPTTPKWDTPQHTVMDPSTVYGISKLAGERWCEYYFLKYGVDVRSIRYPGLIGYKSMPGGGTTDYAVDIFYKAKQQVNFECFLRKDTALPMMYMPDAIDATLGIMDAAKADVKIRSSYNISGFSFSPEEIAAEIKKRLPGFSITYQPDFRQQIADSWPKSISDNEAKNDWGWKAAFDLPAMVKDMLANIK